MIFVAEITAAIDSSGTTQTFYVTTGNGFVTKPSDTPSNTNVYPRLIDPGTYKRELFSGSKTFGAVTPSYGSITIANADGLFDNWKDYGFDGQSFVLRVGEEDGDYPSSFSVVFKCTMVSLKLTDKDITINLSDRLSLLDKPLLNTTLAGTGGVEGSSDMAGQTIPRMFSDAGWVPLKAIDTSKLIYVIHKESAGALAGSIKIYDGGVEIVREADYSTISDITTIAPSAGKCKIYPNGPVYVRLGTAPTYELRAYSFGYKASGASHTYADIAYEAGILDATSANAPTTIYGIYIDDNSVSYLDALNETCKASFAYFGFDKNDIFKSGTIQAPTGTAIYSFNRNNSINISRTSPDFQEVPTYKLTVSSGQVWPCQVAAGATTQMKDYLTRQGWFSTLSSQDNTILNKHKLALSEKIEMRYRINNSTEFTSFKTTYLGLFGVERDQITVECLLTKDNLSSLMAIDLMSVVEVKIPRFGFNAGKNFRVINMSYKLASQKVEFVLWG